MLDSSQFAINRRPPYVFRHSRSNGCSDSIIPSIGCWVCVKFTSSVVCMEFKHVMILLFAAWIHMVSEPQGVSFLHLPWLPLCWDLCIVGHCLQLLLVVIIGCSTIFPLPLFVPLLDSWLDYFLQRVWLSLWQASHAAAFLLIAAPFLADRTAQLPCPRNPLSDSPWAFDLLT